MPLLACLIYLLLVAAVGYAVVSAVLAAPLHDRRHWLEVIGLSVAAGCGVIGTLLFWLSLAGFVPSRITLIATAIITVAALFVLQRRRRLLRPIRPASLRPRWDPRTFLGILSLLLMLAAGANALTEITVRGMSDIDGYAIWLFKAKMTAMQPLRPIPAVLTDPAVSYSHQDYPLGFSLLVAGFYAAAGGIDDQTAKYLLLPIYFALAAVLYAGLRRLVRRRGEALAITSLLVAAPVMVQHAGMPVAEVPLVLQHACCLVLLLRWMYEHRRADLIGAGLFAAFAAFTKNEGLALLPLVDLAAIAFALTQRDRKRLCWDWLISAIVTVAILAPWLAYRHHLPHTHEDYGTKLSDVATLREAVPRLARILPQYLGMLVQLSVAGCIWIVLAVAAVVGFRRLARPAVLVFWGFLLAHVALYALTFMVTPWNLDILLPMVGPKLLLHVAPAAALLIGMHLSAE
jgi:hypothetical protein